VAWLYPASAGTHARQMDLARPRTALDPFSFVLLLAVGRDTAGHFGIGICRATDEEHLAGYRGSLCDLSSKSGLCGYRPAGAAIALPI